MLFSQNGLRPYSGRAIFVQFLIDFKNPEIFKKKIGKPQRKNRHSFFPFFKKNLKFLFKSQILLYFFCKIFYFLSIAGNVQADSEYSIVDRNRNRLLSMPQTSKSGAVLRLAIGEP